MKRRSIKGGGPAKTRRQAPKPQRHNAPKAGRTSSAADRVTEVARLARELNEAREQQTATSEVLKVISGSPSDLRPVFKAMLDNATRICQASLGTMTLYENGEFRHVALH